MKNCLVLLLLIMSTITFAADELTKTKIESMSAAMKNAPDFEVSHPEFHQKQELIPMGDIDAMLALLKQYPDANKEVNTFAQKAGFDNAESFYRYTIRVMSAVSAIMQGKHNPNYNAGRNREMREQALKNRMRFLGEHDKEGIAELEKEFKQMQAQEEQNQKMIASASPADKQFIRENFNWVMSKISQGE
ncbi:hypothetical protein [Litorilituus lipolyticus]|uniref:Uncharacterized protein n=1 Tax=Litorilituus lipolyticus TaxID=2491017 RepID=A0A502L333_9GAMM|nr:hypothetical protein [Litorilituus lipolyticus]TPH17299.1 hypothetical protein EPA86_04755 [Litorilituus lipolyticus]